jgi:hypothetical protein
VVSTSISPFEPCGDETERPQASTPVDETDEVEAPDELADMLTALRVEAEEAEAAKGGTGETEATETRVEERAKVPKEELRPVMMQGQSPKAKVYAGMACGGCGEYLRTAGIFMLGGVVHARHACKLKMARKIERAELITRGRAVGAVPLSVQRTSEGAAAAANQALRPDRPVGRDRAVDRAGPSSMSVGVQGGGEWKRVQADVSLSTSRKAMIKRCIDGECNSEGCAYMKTTCTHCTRGLHVAECGQFGTARAAVGRFKCHYCRAEEMAPDREPSSLRRRDCRRPWIR